MAMDAQANVALLIDADNASAAHLESVLAILAELGTVNIRRAYGNWNKPELRRWADVLHLHAIEPAQQFDVTKGKNASDMKMTIDAMDLLFGGRVQAFGLMSSDSDFVPLVTRLRQDGVAVYGFGTGKAPVSFQNACTRFIDLEGLAKNDEGVRKRIGPDVVKLLFDAIAGSKRDERGFASLSEVGSRLNSVSSFDARSFGFSQLSELFEAVDAIAVERRDNNAVYVKRQR